MAVKRFGPVGIIDIGSNSVRFVAYGGAERVPSVLFNEKIMAALGEGVVREGRLGDKAMASTLEALARFSRLGREMGLKRLSTVATAAVRDASNGKAFLKKVVELGLKPRLVSGEEEAELAGLGVVSAIPGANGVAADLGGGSLELIGVARGGVGEGISLPLGTFRVGRDPERTMIEEAIGDAVRSSRLRGAARDRGLYLVGGSFRALAQLHMGVSGHPLPIVHGHRIPAAELGNLRSALASRSAGEITALANISSARVSSLPAALTILEAMAGMFGPARITVSAFGLREGLLYRELDENVRDEDPLLAAALEVGERLGRFGDHGSSLDTWMNPLFPDESREMQRLRLATCFLGDIAWNAHPDYRAERAVDMAVHGNWVGVDAHGRAVLGRALCSAFGGDGGFSPALATLLKPDEVGRVMAWGRAIRLAQRLCGGTERLLRRTSIGLSGERVLLTIPEKYRMLYSGAVERRLSQLARTMKREHGVRFV